MTANLSTPLILVDGSSFLYRAFHALPPLMNSKGQPTGAVYGVINMLRKLLKDYTPQQVAVIFDAKGKTFRDELYPEYKANRPPMPDDLSSQIQPLHDIVTAMGLPMLIIEGVEADDVIGTLATIATQHQQPTIIATGDKDMAQLVNEHITLINTMTDSKLDVAGVEAKFGVPPKLIIDYLTLIGDNVDNIPGVAKVGPKTAVKWLQKYGSLDNIITHADEFTGKIGDNLRASLSYLPLSRQLVSIKLDLKLNIKLNELQPKPADEQCLIKLFTELEFKGWLAELLGKNQQSQQQHYETILDEKSFNTWLQKLKSAELFSFDTETTDLAYMQAEIVGVSFAVKPETAAYVPVAHDYMGAPQQLSREFVLSKLKPLLEDPNIIKVGQNLKYDMNVLRKYDIHMQGIEFDTMLESYVLNSSANRHNMDSLALKYLGKRTIHFEDIAGKGAKQLTFNQIPLDDASPYAAEDADVTLQLHQTLWPKLKQQEGLQYIFTELEMPLIPVLSRMECHGVLIDAKKLKHQSATLAKRIDALEQQAYKIAQSKFNLSSPKQLQEILYEKCQLPILQKTPKGQPSTAESVLQDLAHDYPLPKIILEYRSLSKLKSTYTDKLPLQINAHTGRIHTSYNQTVAATGRLSSSDPNLQNIPVRTEQGRNIRQAFVAPKGFQLISADYSQIELRIMAHLSQDKGLRDAFAKGLDIHKATAAEVFGISIDKVTNDQRRSAKAINFGLIYGMSAFGLAKQLGISRDAADRYIEVYFQRYPGVKNYMEATRAQAHQQGYVETLYGRRLNLAEINSANMQRRRAAERTAINAPMQGTAADIIKRAMITVDQWLTTTNYDAYMIMQVHDELVLEVADKHVADVKKALQKSMSEAAQLSVPLIVDVGVGNNWDEAH